jgi:hypothetical protein
MHFRPHDVNLADNGVCGTRERRWGPARFLPVSTNLIRIAVAESAAAALDTPASLEPAEHWIARGAQQSAELIVLPEAFLGGYPVSAHICTDSEVNRA